MDTEVAMAHKVIIIDSISNALQDSEVRDTFTPAQCVKVDQILNGPQPCSDEDFRYLVRRLTRAYCAED
jgi:hypothetical protein